MWSVSGHATYHRCGPYFEARAFSGVLTECSVCPWGSFHSDRGKGGTQMSISSEPHSRHSGTGDDSLQSHMEHPFWQLSSLTYSELYILAVLEDKSDVFWYLPPQLSNTTAHLSLFCCTEMPAHWNWGHDSTIIWLTSCVSLLSTITVLLCLLSHTWNVLPHIYLSCFIIVFVKRSNLVPFILSWLKAEVPP